MANDPVEMDFIKRSLSTARTASALIQSTMAGDSDVLRSLYLQLMDDSLEIMGEGLNEMGI